MDSNSIPAHGSERCKIPRSTIDLETEFFGFRFDKQAKEKTSKKAIDFERNFLIEKAF